MKTDFDKRCTAPWFSVDRNRKRSMRRRRTQERYTLPALFWESACILGKGPSTSRLLVKMSSELDKDKPSDLASDKDNKGVKRSAGESDINVRTLVLTSF